MTEFDPADSLCNKPPEEIAKYLDLIGDHEGAADIRTEYGLPKPARRYRERAIVEADQFLPPENIPKGCFQKDRTGEWLLATRSGVMRLCRGDYVVTGPETNKWIVPERVFQTRYEEVNE